MDALYYRTQFGALLGQRHARLQFADDDKKTLSALALHLFCRLQREPQTFLHILTNGLGKSKIARHHAHNSARLSIHRNGAIQYFGVGTEYVSPQSF